MKSEKIIIGVMASRRRAMTELGRVTFFPDTTSGWWLTTHTDREKKEREKGNKDCLSRTSRERERERERERLNK